MQIQIQKATLEEILPLRHLVLRPHVLTLEQCKNPNDDQEETLHLSAKNQNQIIGIATFEKDLNEELLKTENFNSSYRLRGMAVHPQFRRLGVGMSLVQFGEIELRKRGCDFIWFNARIGAFSFYESMEYKFFGDFFDVPHIGTHKVMYKALITR